MSRRSVVTTLVVAIVSFMTLAGVVLAVLMSTRGGQGLGFGGRIAVMEINGVIEDDARFLEDLRDFRSDRSVRGYLVNINSPGGVVAPSQSIFQELRRVRSEDSVPVVAAISSVGASGGYYIALAADSIFALPGSITGSIGVIMEIPDVTGLMDKVGVRMQTVQSAAHKDAGSPFRPLSEGDRALLEAMVLDVYDQFVDAVATERGLERSAVLPLADGRILTGRQAVGQRLVDRLGNREDALATAGRMAGLGSDPGTVRPPEDRPTMFDVLLGRTAVGLWRRFAAPMEAAVAAPSLKFMIPF